MLFISQSKKIILLALSLFFVSLSILFVLSSYGGEPGEHFGENLFGSLFARQYGGEQAHENTFDEKSPVLIVTKSGEFVEANENFLETFGLTSGDLKREEFFSFFHPEDLAGFVGTFTKVSQQKEEREVYSGPFRFQAEHEKFRLVIVTLRQQKDLIVLTFKDITDSVEELKESSDDSEEEGGEEGGEAAGKTIEKMGDDEKARIVVEKR